MDHLSKLFLFLPFALIIHSALATPKLSAIEPLIRYLNTLPNENHLIKSCWEHVGEKFMTAQYLTARRVAVATAITEYLTEKNVIPDAANAKNLIRGIKANPKRPINGHSPIRCFRVNLQSRDRVDERTYEVEVVLDHLMVVRSLTLDLRKMVINLDKKISTPPVLEEPDLDLDQDVEYPEVDLESSSIQALKEFVERGNIPEIKGRGVRILTTLIPESELGRRRLMRATFNGLVDNVTNRLDFSLKGAEFAKNLIDTLISEKLINKAVRATWFDQMLTELQQGS